MTEANPPATATDAAPSRGPRRVPGGRGPSLAAHVDRAMQRLTQALLELGRFAPEEASAARAAMEAALATLDRLQADARGARGEARAAIVAALATADDALAAALVGCAAAGGRRGTDADRAQPSWPRSPAAWRQPDLASAEAAALARLAP